MHIAPNHTRVGMGIYSTNSKISFYLDSVENYEEARAAILNTPYIYGDTNTADALKMMRENLFRERTGDRPNVQNFGIVVTDGVSNVRDWRTVPEAHECKDAGIHIVTVGIGMRDVEEIYAISSQPKGENTLLSDTFDDLPSISHKLVTTICEGRLKSSPGVISLQNNTMRAEL